MHNKWASSKALSRECWPANLLCMPKVIIGPSPQSCYSLTNNQSLTFVPPSCCAAKVTVTAYIKHCPLMMQGRCQLLKGGLTSSKVEDPLTTNPVNMPDGEFQEILDQILCLFTQDCKCGLVDFPLPLYLVTTDNSPTSLCSSFWNEAK
jgi:hypothetical protein